MVNHPNSESPPPLSATPRKTTTGVIFVVRLSLTRLFHCMSKIKGLLAGFCSITFGLFEITITSGALIAVADEIL